MPVAALLPLASLPPCLLLLLLLMPPLLPGTSLPVASPPTPLPLMSFSSSVALGACASLCASRAGAVGGQWAELLRMDAASGLSPMSCGQCTEKTGQNPCCLSQHFFRGPSLWEEKESVSRLTYA